MLHARAFRVPPSRRAWNVQLEEHSLGWVTAREEERLVGFVNVAWDGVVHAFLLDTVVVEDHRRRGIGRELVRLASERARTAGCRWLHVDFEEGLELFYLSGCGFRTTGAGVLAL
ncbi:MAG: GNAT family N-acetyltransferase [Acidimicrobiales bacterium]